MVSEVAGLRKSLPVLWWWNLCHPLVGHDIFPEVSISSVLCPSTATYVMSLYPGL